MKVIACEQGTMAWHLARAGVPTASEFDNLVTPKWEIRTGQMPQTYLAKKLAEWWGHGPLLGGGGGMDTFATEQGRILEHEALPWYQLTYGVDVNRVGFCTSDDGRIGCSPDGLIGEDSGIEVKCPEAHTHVSYLLKGTLPDDYTAQVHGSILVTGRPEWRFLSYRRNFPPLVIFVERSKEIEAVLTEALESFHAKFKLGQERLLDINGGPPPARPESDDSPNPVYHIDVPGDIYA